MSNHPRKRKHGLLTDMLGPLDGAKIPGGCDECDAYQTTAPMKGMGGMGWAITVHHDDDCPFLARHNAK